MKSSPQENIRCHDDPFFRVPVHWIGVFGFQCNAPECWLTPLRGITATEDAMTSCLPCAWGCQHENRPINFRHLTSQKCTL